MDPQLKQRYRRQIAFEPLGETGQGRLASATVLVVGCGGLGAAAASALARAGIGRLRLVDDDRVELDNLHRQILFDEAEIGEPKVEVAARKLRAISSRLMVERHVARLEPSTIDALLTGVSLVIDATDRLDTRYLINDGCLRHDVPWVYGGVDGAAGMTMTILPRRGPCFACLFPRDSGARDAPASGDDAAPGGAVLGPVPAAVAAIQAVQACRVLGAVGSRDAATMTPLLWFDLWEQRWQWIEVARDDRCAACGEPAAGDDDPPSGG